jgi:hypothetical protein
LGVFKPGVPINGTPVKNFNLLNIACHLHKDLCAPPSLIKSTHFQICSPFYSNAKFLSTFEPFFAKSGYFLSGFSGNSEATLPLYITARSNKPLNLVS